MPFNSCNRESITKILSQTSKDTILTQAFPLTLYIQLVPELNVITISVASVNEFMQTDALLVDLISIDDQGS